ncbi:MAG: type II toxin-antitoxin system RelE/ParE family toxin [Patescibacteria group bacterium]
MYSISFASSAIREYKRLPLDFQKVVAAVFEGEFRNNPFSHTLDVRKLQKPLVGYRLRIGEYRVLYTVKKEMITIYRIRHRKDAYK